MLKELNALPKAVKSFDFLARLNKSFADTNNERKLYNPIDMLNCYHSRNFSCYTIPKAIAADKKTPLTPTTIQAATADEPTLLSYNKLQLNRPIPLPKKPRPKKTPSPKKATVPSAPVSKWENVEPNTEKNAFDSPIIAFSLMSPTPKKRKGEPRASTNTQISKITP
ncbi:MAG: hypothetical protein QNK11_02910 [Legionella sp.]|nr:hypothetical protein [Legionella sp.]